MLDTAFAPQDAIAQLDALAASARLPSRDADRCKRLADTLRRPARVCVLGPRKGHMARVVSALLGVPELAADMLPPAMELRFGPSLRTSATLEDGTAQVTLGWPTPELLHSDPIFLQIDLPSERLKPMSLLVLTLETDPAVYRPALAWAARRSEIAVWCTPSFNVADARIWASAPERLTQHAYLLETRPDTTVPRHAAVAGFTQVFGLSGIDDPLIAPDTAPLFDRLMADIEEARVADLDMVQLFLHRLGHLIPVGQRLTDGCAVDVGCRVEPTGPDLRPILSEPTLYLMRRTRDLAETLGASAPDDWPPHMLAHCADTAEALRERAENWPDISGVVRGLQTLIDEICDTMTLLSIEGRAEQAQDAAALLFQLRIAFEQALGREEP